MSARRAELLGRLGSGEARTRRIAVADLIREYGADPEVVESLAARLACEADEKAAVAIVRHLGRVDYRPARAMLWSLYASRSTPARLAHAAVLAHDAIELRESGREPMMGACPPEHR